MVNGLVAEDLGLVDVNRSWGGVAKHQVCDVEGCFVDVGLGNAWVAYVDPALKSASIYPAGEVRSLQRQGDNQHNGRKDDQVHPPPLLEVGADSSEKASRCDGLSGDGLSIDVLDLGFVGHLYSFSFRLVGIDLRRLVYVSDLSGS